MPDRPLSFGKTDVQKAPKKALIFPLSAKNQKGKFSLFGFSALFRKTDALKHSKRHLFFHFLQKINASYYIRGQIRFSKRTNWIFHFTFILFASMRGIGTVLEWNKQLAPLRSARLPHLPSTPPKNVVHGGFYSNPQTSPTVSKNGYTEPYWGASEDCGACPPGASPLALSAASESRFLSKITAQRRG